MRYFKPNSISLFLMVAGMVLLAAFQAFWLRKEYNEQKSILQKETDILFRNTIQTLEDSVIQKKIGFPIKEFGDTVLPRPNAYFLKTASTKPARKLKIGYAHNKTTAIYSNSLPAKEDEKSTVKMEGRGILGLREVARFIQTSKMDTVVSPQNNLLDILRKTHPEDIQSVKFNSIGNLDITELTVSDSTPKGKSEVLIVKSHNPPDSLKRLFSKVARVVMLSKGKQDSLLTFARDSKPTENVKISVNIRPQKPTSTLKNQKELKMAEERFFIRLDHDSLKIKDIDRLYSQQIQKAKINLPFYILRRQIAQPFPKPDKAVLTTSSVNTAMPIGSTYAALFPDYKGYLLKKIIPQGLFSFFLLTIISLAFGTIYRNLRQQRRLTELKNDFISNVTHELKTPIATVSVAIEALQSFGAAQNPELTKEYLEISKNELNRLTLLVDKVLKMSAFEQQGLSLSLEAVHLPELVEQVLNSLKLQFEKYKAKVSVATSGQNFVVSADKIHLTNVVYNLLDNALKYSKNTPEIRIEIQDGGDEVRLSVTDRGIGILPEFQDKVFEKFFRVPTGNTHDVKGYGLGLSYVASVVKQHGGQIHVQSEPEKGSTFTVLLPKNV
ncbi:MAG: HAMP domain-containing sensor histidine kinase [Spirosomataceae bacterium]